jgi:hypothetical protein
LSVKTVEFALGHGRFDPDEDILVVVNLFQVGQVIGIQRAGGGDDRAERRTLDRINLAVINMFPKTFCRFTSHALEGHKISRLESTLTIVLLFSRLSTICLTCNRS